MTQTELRDAVRGILQDPAGVRFLDPQVDRYTNQALRRVERAIGKTQKRLSLNLQQGVQIYALPATGVLRVISVQIIPENGAYQSNLPALQEVDLHAIPPQLPDEKDPDRYAINLAGGADQNQIELQMFPAPARSTSDAIVVTYDGDFTTATEIPFPETYDLVIQRLTAAGCLSEEDDETSIRKAEYLRTLAEEELRDLSYMGSLSDVNNAVRTFP